MNSFFQNIEDRKRYFNLGFLLIMLLVYIGLNLWVSKFNVHNSWGDDWTIMLSMYAGKNFAENGFVKSKFTPVIPYSASSKKIGGNHFYTHYPPLPYYFGGILWYLGGDELVFYKLMYILFAAAYLLGLYFLIERLINGHLALCVIIVIILQKVAYIQLPTTPVVIADTFFVWGLYFIVLAAESKGRKSLLYFSISWLLIFLNSWSSFEYIVAAQIVATAIIFFKISDNKKRIYWTVFIGLAPVLMMILHFFANAWALGGIDKAYQDLARAFLWRTVDVGRNTNYLNTIAGGAANFPFWLFRQITNLYQLAPFYKVFYKVPLRAAQWNGNVSFTLFLVYLPLISTIIGPILIRVMDKGNTKIRLFLKYFLVFLISNLSFWLIFQQLASIHFYRQTGRHLLITYGILIGGSIYFMIKQISSKNNSTAIRTIFSLLLLGALSIPLNNARSTFNEMNKLRKQTWSEEVEILRKVDSQVEKESIILTTHKNIAEAAFLHQPCEVFKLKGFKVVWLDPKGKILEIMKEVQIKEGEHYLLMKQSDFIQFAASDLGMIKNYRVESRFNKYDLSFYKYLINEKDPMSIDSALNVSTVSGSQNETSSLKIYSGTYGSTISVVDSSLELKTRGIGQYCIKITSNGANKSGIQTNKPFRFKVRKGISYLLSWRVYCKESCTSFKAAVATDSGVNWVKYPFNKTSFKNVPGKWTEFKGIYSCSESKDNAFIFIHQNEKKNLTWFVDDIRLIEL